MWTLFACAAPTPPLRGEAVYVWQSAWSSPVHTAVTNARAAGLGVYALHAEITAEVRTIAVPDIGAHGAVVRVHDPARLDDARPVLDALVTRPDVVEVQLDVDTPTGRLGAYADWLATLDLPVPVSITALPDWLSSPALGDVLERVDAWTIQLHAPPRQAEDRLLVDVDLDEVSTPGVPFRVALPTYGVGLARDRDGVTIGVVGEGVRFDGPEVWADPAAVAAVVRALPTGDPDFLGVTWFRLPVEGDRWTWSSSTWAAVREGRAPEPSLRLEAHGVDLRVRNTGEGDAAALPIRLSGEIQAFDAVGGWRATPEGASVRFDPPSRPVPAGEARPVGWARGTYTVAWVGATEAGP